MESFTATRLEIPGAVKVSLKSLSAASSIHIGGAHWSEFSHLSEAEKSSAVLLFDSSDYDELDRYSSSSRYKWEQYHPDDRKKTTEQHGCYTRWFIRKGAKPDMGTKIANARARLEEAEQSLRSAQFSVESRTRELQELERTYAEDAPLQTADVAQRQLPKQSQTLLH